MSTKQLHTVQGWKDTLTTRPWKSLSTLLLGDHQSRYNKSDKESKSFDALHIQTNTLDEVQDFFELLPPPKKYGRKLAMQTSQRAPDSTDPRAWTLEFSVSKPHRILHASEEFLSLLNYSSHQICNRTIGVLQGPNTNAKELQAAFKSAVMSVPTSLSQVLYSSDGKEHALNLECDYLPETEGDDSKGAIRLRVRLPVCLDEALITQHAMTCADDETKRFLRQYRFHTGLDIQHAMRRTTCL
jgi:hypothetical protein